MTWTGQSFTVGQILTAAQMNNLQADITAQANGDSGAPKQQTAGIQALAVTTGKIANDAVSFGNGKLDNTKTDSSWSMGISDTQIIPSGVFYIYHDAVTSGSTSLSALINGGWKTIDSSGFGGAKVYQCVVSDGTNVRLSTGAGAAVTVYYKRLYQ